MARHAIKMAYLQHLHRGVTVGCRKQEIAGAFCYNRSTCDDERELLALSHRDNSSGQDCCHSEMLRDSVIVQRYGPNSKDAIVGTNVITDEFKRLTETWLHLFGSMFRIVGRLPKRKLISSKCPVVEGVRTAKKLRIYHIGFGTPDDLSTVG